MFRFVSIFAILASVAAFAPMSRVARSSAVAGWKGNSAFENEIGVQAPLGLYDPLNLLDGADQARFDRLREVETKHGRISMLAILGHLVTTAGVRLPGVLNEGGADAIAFKDIRAGTSPRPRPRFLSVVSWPCPGRRPRRPSPPHPPI
jgi:hypothetical protein